jgi:hypothetical protein
MAAGFPWRSTMIVSPFSASRSNRVNEFLAVATVTRIVSIVSNPKGDRTMMNQEPRENEEVTNPNEDVVVDSNLVLKLMRQQAEHIDRQDDRIARLEERDAKKDELMLGMQREISLLASAISGHQRIFEASQPTPEPEPPKPPPVMN